MIDGVGSRDGRVLIMTTTGNHIARLDKAFIRPGRIDKKVELGLDDKKMTANLFCVVFKHVEGHVAPPKNAESDVLVGEDRKVHKAERSRGELRCAFIERDSSRRTGAVFVRFGARDSSREGG